MPFSRETLMVYLFADKVEYSGLKCLQTVKLSVTEEKKTRGIALTPSKYFLHFSSYNWHQTQNY